MGLFRQPEGLALRTLHGYKPRMFVDLVFALLAVGLLWCAADWIVDSAAAIARSRGVSELVIGLTIVAFGTSTPEFMVTLSASVKQMPDISLANVVGSNFANLGIVLGLCALVVPVAASRLLVLRDGGLLLLLTGGVALAAWGEALGPLTGLGLLGFLAGYLWMLFRNRECGAACEADDGRMARWWDYPRLLTGFAGVAVGGTLLVETAANLARTAGVSEWFIGLTLVAVGTSLPELATCLAAALRGRSDMLLGNLIGSNIFNYAGVLGLTCLISPLTPTPQAAFGAVLNVGFVLLALVFMRTGWRVTRLEGLVLLFLNLLVIGVAWRG